MNDFELALYKALGATVTVLVQDMVDHGLKFPDEYRTFLLEWLEIVDKNDQSSTIDFVTNAVSICLSDYGQSKKAQQ